MNIPVVCSFKKSLICKEISRNVCKSKNSFYGRVLMALTGFHSVELKNNEIYKKIVQDEYTYTVLTCTCRPPGTKRATKPFVIT